MFQYFNKKNKGEKMIEMIDDMWLYIGGGVGLITFAAIMLKSKNKKNVNTSKPDRSWTLTPPTAVLLTSRMKNVSGGKGVNKKEIMAERSTPKAKAANWQSVGSFEDDVSQINLDSIMTKKIKSSGSNAFERRQTDIKNKSIKNNPNISSNERINNNNNENNDFNSNYEANNSIKEKVKQEYKIRILLVDDSAVILKKTGDILKANNYDVITKKDGQEAINWLKDNLIIPEVVITDMEMPVMTGEQLVEEMRSDERFSEIPILVISAHAERHIGLMEKQMIQGFLKKPFTESDLNSQLNFLLS